jgi:hypothetical protein
MATPNPACLVNGQVPAYVASASATITISLASPAGANFWSVSCTSTDELNTPAAVNATLSINQTNKTATCTLSAVLGSAYIFTSTVGILGLGLDANAVQQPAFTTTFKVNVKASNAAIVLAENETFEQSAPAGWFAVINPALRAGVSVPISVGSTGFVHITGGVFDANARAITLSSNGAGGDVTGLLAAINGGRVQGDINVNHSTPGTFDSTHQVALCDTATGTCSITFPLSSAFPGSVIPVDWQLVVADTAGQASANAITVNPNGETLWDPNAGAFGTSNVTLGGNGNPATNGIVGVWQWDTNKSHWFLVNSTSSSSAIGAPGATISGNTTITAAMFWRLFQAVAGGYTLTLGTLLPGVLYRFQHVNGAAGSNLLETTGQAVTLSRGSNTFTIEDPQNRFAALANSVAFRVSEQTYEFMLDSTNNVLRCMRQVQ